MRITSLEEIVGYLATPLTALTTKEDSELRRIVKLIRDVASDKEFVKPSFRVYWPGDHTHPKDHIDLRAHQVYLTDRSRASTNDFIILFCGAPSYGVGQENEIATQARIPAIRLIPPTMSRMMLGSFIHAEDIMYSGTLQESRSPTPISFARSLGISEKLIFDIGRSQDFERRGVWEASEV